MKHELVYGPAVTDLVLNGGANLPPDHKWTVGRNGQKKEISEAEVIVKYLERKAANGEFIETMKALSDGPVTGPLLDALGALTPHRGKIGKKGGVFSAQISYSDHGAVKFCVEADLKDRKGAFPEMRLAGRTGGGCRR